MPARYERLPNATPDDDERDDLDRAFDDSDDEADESRPLNPAPTSSERTHSARPSVHIPGTYDFEDADRYDYPPPGSPPGPSTTALPNEHGNSNGLVPEFSVDSVSRGPRLGWFKRAATSVLPTHYVQRLGISDRAVVGNNNDGVFANVTAKPTAPVRIQDGDSTYIVPEEVRAEAPPSYASAQADAVPQYYEVHAPFAPGTAGEMIIDALPSGTLFSFLWNMLVSISFQFVGFLLTYLLHTTHAARLGSRAGLGITLIQYGFALRTKNDGADDDSANGWGTWTAPRPTFATAAEAAAYYNGTATDSVVPELTQEQANAIVADATSEWLSFFLMTIGWFILLTSVLGFWRVKRWERGVLASQRENPGAAPPPLSAGLFHFERGFGLRGISQSDLFRQGFGFGSRTSEEQQRERAEEEAEYVIPADASPEQIQRLQEAIQNERRLHSELRAAGLL